MILAIIEISIEDPVTDVGKRSKRGRLALTESFETVRLEELGSREDLLGVVFRDGRLLRDYGFDEVRRNNFNIFLSQ